MTLTLLHVCMCVYSAKRDALFLALVIWGSNSNPLAPLGLLLFQNGHWTVGDTVCSGYNSIYLQHVYVYIPVLAGPLACFMVHTCTLNGGAYI